MASHKKPNGDKLRKKQERKERIEHLTNWYMINLCWGLAAMIVLTIIYYCYRSSGTILYMQPAMWVLTGMFAIGGLAVWILGKCKVIKNTSRANHYAIFLCFCTLGGLWLALYNKIRPLLQSAARVILRNENLSVSSYWNVWLLMIAILVYLVIAFIYYAVKVNKK